MDKLNVVVIGTGFGAVVHAPSYQLNDKYNLMGIYGNNYEKSCEIAMNHGIRAYKDKVDIVNDGNVDLVSIASVVSDHYNDVKMFINNKKNIILEKPMSINSKQSKELVDLAKTYDVNTAVCHEHKYDSSWQYLKMLIEKELYGKIRSIDFKYSFTYWNNFNSERKYDWFSEKKCGGGIIGAHLSHVIDLLNFIDDSKVKEIYGKGFIEVPFHYNKENQLMKQTAEDTISAIAIMNSGIPAYINLSAARCESYKKAEIYTEGAKITIFGQNKIEICDNKGQLISCSIPQQYLIEDYHEDIRMNSFMRLIDDFYAKYYQGKESIITDFAKGHETQKLLEQLTVEG